nr:DUF397 domain-containing protein [Micromonospora sp. DSM 115978]
MFLNRSDERFHPEAWTKATASDGNNECVMVQVTPDLVGVCDSKAGPNGAVLAFHPAQWAAFASAAGVHVTS